MHLSTIFTFYLLPISCSFQWFSYLLVLFCSYIVRELITKNALASFSLPTYFSDWVNVFSSLCVYKTTQTTKFHESHLQTAGWYFDCSAGFVPWIEKPLFASLVSSVPVKNIVTFEVPNIVELPLSPPKTPRRMGRAKKTITQASCLVVTWSASKISVESPTFLWSPSDTPSDAPSIVLSVPMR
jgi:hypothetical protein